MSVESTRIVNNDRQCTMYIHIFHLPHVSAFVYIFLHFPNLHISHLAGLQGFRINDKTHENTGNVEKHGKWEI